MPIGSEAVYVDVDLVPSRGVGIDVKHFLVLDTLNPLRPIVGFNSFAPRSGRCSGTENMNGLMVHLPDSFLVPDVYSGSPYGVKPNASFVFLLPDLQTTWNGPSIARCSSEGPLYMRSSQKWPNNRNGDDLFGDGLTDTGGQGASSMSGLGGTIRLGELIGEEPIRHAIKINPWGAHLYFGPDRPGFRWPATSADNYANDPSHKNQYVGQNPELVMGSLLAVPTDITAQELGLLTEPGRKILFVLQHYGAYITEDAGWDVFDFIIQEGVEQEFEQAYGFSMKSDIWETEILKIAEVLQVIANNGPQRVGGGGTPLQPLACGLGVVGSSAFCEAVADSVITSVMIDLCPDSTLVVGNDHHFRAEVTPANLANQELIWFSLDTTVAQVDSSGRVHLIGPGETAVVVATIDTAAVDSCHFQVSNPIVFVQDLLSHWQFDSSQIDISGNNHPALLQGASFTSNRIQGSYALLLDGSDDWVDITHPSLQGSFDERTVMMWVNMDNRGPSSVIYEEGGGYNGLAIKVENARLYVRAKVASDVVDLSIPYTYRNYQHVAVTFDHGTVRLFHNGALVGSDSLPLGSMPSHGNPAALGATNGWDVWQGETGQFMKGKLDDVRIYARAISSSGVADIVEDFAASSLVPVQQPLSRTMLMPYPNPSSGIFWVAGESSMPIRVFDLSGALIMQEAQTTQQSPSQN